MENKSELLVTVLTASLVHQIHIAKALLASRGISSFIFDENIMSTIGTAYVEGYKLEVNDSDYAQAKAILDEENNKEEE